MYLAHDDRLWGLPTTHDPILRARFWYTAMLEGKHDAGRKKAFSLRQTWRCVQHRYRGGRPHRPADGRSEVECQSPGGRSAPSYSACGIQIPSDRVGVLGCGRPTNILGQVDG